MNNRWIKSSWQDYDWSFLQAANLDKPELYRKGICISAYASFETADTWFHKQNSTIPNKTVDMFYAIHWLKLLVTEEIY